MWRHARAIASPTTTHRQIAEAPQVRHHGYGHDAAHLVVHDHLVVRCVRCARMTFLERRAPASPLRACARMHAQRSVCRPASPQLPMYQIAEDPHVHHQSPSSNCRAQRTLSSMTIWSYSMPASPPLPADEDRTLSRTYTCIRTHHTMRVHEINCNGVRHWYHAYGPCLRGRTGPRLLASSGTAPARSSTLALLRHPPTSGYSGLAVRSRGAPAPPPTHPPAGTACAPRRLRGAQSWPPAPCSAPACRRGRRGWGSG